MYPDYPDTINQFVFVGDFGFDDYSGLFEFEIEEGFWTVSLSTEDISELRKQALFDHEGHHVIAYADCQPVVGGKCINVIQYDGEARLDVVVDSCPLARNTRV